MNMKKWLIPILAGVALAMFVRWAWADFGTSIDGKEASVTCTHTAACDSAWVVFGYDGDAAAVDTANMYDSLKVLPCFSGNGKTLCGDGLDLDSIGTHVVKIYYFSGDAIIDIQVGIWEHRAGIIGTPDVNVAQVDGDTSAVKNFKRAFDGDSTTWAWKFQVRQFQAIADQGNNDALYLSGFGMGSGIYGTSAGNGFGANLMGNTNSGLRVGCASGNCDGAYIFGYGDANGLRIESGTSAESPSAGVFIDGFDLGDGLHIAATQNAVVIDGTQDIVLAGDGVIHGTIDVATALGAAERKAIADSVWFADTSEYGDEFSPDSTMGYMLIAGGYGGGGSSPWATTAVDSLMDAIFAGFAGTRDTNLIQMVIDSLIAFKDSVENAITDPNKENFKYGGGADSMRSYLATHDSTLLELAAACGSGTGTRTVTITVKNAADSVAISGFEIAIYDSSSGEPQANGTTNSNGVYTCSLDDETYTVHIKNPPWSLTSPRRFVITANMDSTFYATRFTPGSPPADSLCVVWGRVKDKHGDPYVGAKVSIWMDAYPVTFAGILIDVATKSVTYTNTDGVFEFSDGIYYSSSLSPSNLKWHIRIKTKNAEWIWEGMVAVPSQASWEIEIPDL